MNDSADYAIAVTAGMVFIRLQRAIEGDAQPSSVDFLSKTLIRHLEALKITRHARKGTDPRLRGDKHQPAQPGTVGFRTDREDKAATERTGFRNRSSKSAWR
jgi:hypothetical protein